MSTKPKIIEGPYSRDILAQPLALRETLAALRDTPVELEAIASVKNPLNPEMAQWTLTEKGKVILAQ